MAAISLQCNLLIFHNSAALNAISFCFVTNSERLIVYSTAWKQRWHIKLNDSNTVNMNMTKNDLEGECHFSTDYSQLEFNLCTSLAFLAPFLLLLTYRSILRRHKPRPQKSQPFAPPNIRELSSKRVFSSQQRQESPQGSCGRLKSLWE